MKIAYRPWRLTATMSRMWAGLSLGDSAYHSDKRSFRSLDNGRIQPTVNRRIGPCTVLSSVFSASSSRVPARRDRRYAGRTLGACTSCVRAAFGQLCHFRRSCRSPMGAALSVNGDPSATSDAAEELSRPRPFPQAPHVTRSCRLTARRALARMRSGERQCRGLHQGYEVAWFLRLA